MDYSRMNKVQLIEEIEALEKKIAELERAETERKRAEEALQASARQWQATFDAVSDAVCLLNLEGGILRCNVAMTDLLGKPFGEIIGRTCWQLVHGTSEPIEGCPVVRMRETRCRETLVLRIGERWLEVSVDPLLDEAGDLIGSVHIMSDITERKRAEEALRQSEERSRRLSEAAFEAIAIHEGGVLLSANDQFFEMFGYEPNESLGKQVIPLTVAPEAREFMRKQIVTGGLGPYESIGLRKDGTKLPMEIRVREMEYEGRKVRVAAIMDITERKRAEEDLRKYREHLEELVEERTAELAVAKERAEAADRLKSAFLATMSHELRTPLNSIIGFTGIMLQGLAGPLNLEQEKQLNMVYGSAKHLLALINDILDLSKIEAGEVEIVKEEFDVASLINKVVKTVSPLAEQKGLELAVALSPEVGRIYSDRRRVEQILLNLLNNAIKFTERGWVRIEGAIVDKHLQVSVQDTGIGIKPEDMGKLFQVFRQIDATITRQHEGTGLGLAICKKLVTILGGEIWAESEGEGRGSTFAFTLPISD